MAGAVIGVQGMSCNHCKMSVEKALKALPGVRGADVSLERKNVAVDYDPDQVNLERMREAILHAGYEVS